MLTFIQFAKHFTQAVSDATLVSDDGLLMEAHKGASWWRVCYQRGLPRPVFIQTLLHLHFLTIGIKYSFRCLKGLYFKFWQSFLS